MYCSHCGKQIPDNAKFCPVCGTKIVENKRNNVDPMDLLEHKSTNQHHHAASNGSGMAEQKSGTSLIWKVAIGFFIIMLILSIWGR